jgi:rfaE bifunctional protein kinase chain/domain
MKNLEDINILVIGDIMLDKYVVGQVERISPEAPVPVVNVLEEYSTLGGCGNVVRNLRELNVNVDCLASIGPDENGREITTKLNQIGAGCFVFFGSKVSTVKERIVSDQRQVQMLRIDREMRSPIDHNMAIEYHTRMTSGGNKRYDIVIVSDYAKGMVSYELIQHFKQEGYKIIVDPKPQNGYIYNGVHMITPNEKEWNSMIVSSAYNLDKVHYILVTKGKDGMSLKKNGDPKDKKIEGKPVEIFNVSGAGDTVVAVMSTCISMGMDEYHAAMIANECAADVVTRPGTSVISKNKFMQILQSITAKYRI